MMGGEKEKRRGETKKDDHLPNSLIRLLDRIQLISFFFFFNYYHTHFHYFVEDQTRHLAEIFLESAEWQSQNPPPPLPEEPKGGEGRNPLAQFSRFPRRNVARLRDEEGGEGGEAALLPLLWTGVSRSNFTALPSRRRCAPCTPVKPF